MSSSERDRDRDRNTQEVETVPRSGVTARPSPAGKLRSELGASFPSTHKQQGSADRDNGKGQFAGRLRQVGGRINRGNNHGEATRLTDARSRLSRSNGRPQRRSGSRNRQRWSASPAYQRGESPMSDASGQQYNVRRLRNDKVLFTRPTQHDVATRLLNRTRNTNRTRAGEAQSNAMKPNGNRLANRNRKRKRLYSESVITHADNNSGDEELLRSGIRKKAGRFAKRRRFAALRRNERANNAEKNRSQSAQRGDAIHFSPAFGNSWRSPAGVLLDRPRKSPPANSNEYLINEHNQIDGVSPIVYKATSSHSTATTPFGGTYTFPYTAAYRPDYVEETVTVAAHRDPATSKHRDDEAEVSTSSPNGNDGTAGGAAKRETTTDNNSAEDSNGQNSAASAGARASRRRAQTNNCAPSQYDAEFSELYVNTLLDRFQQMNKQELVTQCLSLSGEVEQLEARLRDLKKQNDRLARTGTGATGSSNASVSNAVSSSALQVTVPVGSPPRNALQSQCSVSSSNVVLDAHVDETSIGVRTEEAEPEGQEGSTAHGSSAV